MRERKRRGGIFLHVSILFFVSILTTGLFTFITEKQLSDRSVKRGIERLAKQIAEEVRRSVTEYPAYEWFLCYWYEHPDSLDIEKARSSLPGIRISSSVTRNLPSWKRSRRRTGSSAPRLFIPG